MRLKNYKAAIADYTEALKKLTNPDVYRRRARAYTLTGQADLAAQDEKKANAFTDALFEDAPFTSNKTEKKGTSGPRAAR